MSEVPTLRGLSLRAAYATSSDSLLRDFYVPCLSRSSRYDRLAGFFSSAVLALAPLAFADFFRRGGTARLVCSPRLTSSDFAAMASAARGEDILRAHVVADLEALEREGPQATALVRAMSSMIAADVLRVKIAVPRSAQGLFHDKTGIFFDENGDRVSFVGSTNESAAAWSGLINHEQIETFASWESVDGAARTRRHARMFEETWLNARRGLRVLEPNEAAELITSISEPDDLEVALSAIRALQDRSGARQASDPSKPRELLPHQADVIDHWVQQGHHGLVAFATGAGKTMTGIAAMKKWCDSGRPAIALVPSELLQQQWFSEIRREYPALQVLRAGAEGQRSRWMNEAANWTSRNPTFGPRCILATYQTARTDAFLSRVRDGEHLMLLADEVHRIGANDTRVIMERIDAGARMGLSATPERYGDPAGTAEIFSYFGTILEPTYGLPEAIRDGRLVPYVYRFETCSLSEDEQLEYDSLTSQIGQAYARERAGAESASSPSEYLAGLLRKRARILKKTQSKAPLARRILEERYHPGQRWLVYCESVDHLREVRDALKELDLPLLEYHRAMPGDKGATLDYFSERSGVLLAIKCLDEGVDIPATDHALILASTTNPREYIQRRGRVLRTAPLKFNAEVYDALVVKPDGYAIAQSELHRAMEFAQHSENRAVVYDLKRLASPHQVDWERATGEQEMETDESG